MCLWTPENSTAFVRALVQHWARIVTVEDDMARNEKELRKAFDFVVRQGFVFG